MTRSGVVFAKNRMMNDSGGHAHKVLIMSTKIKHCLNPNSATVRNRNESGTSAGVRSRMFFKQISGLRLRNGVCRDECREQGQHVPEAKYSRRSTMKRLLAFILVLSLLVLTGTLVSADGQARRRDRSRPQALAQRQSPVLLRHRLY